MNLKALDPVKAKPELAKVLNDANADRQTLKREREVKKRQLTAAASTAPKAKKSKTDNTDAKQSDR